MTSVYQGASTHSFTYTCTYTWSDSVASCNSHTVSSIVEEVAGTANVFNGRIVSGTPVQVMRAMQIRFLDTGGN